MPSGRAPFSYLWVFPPGPVCAFLYAPGSRSPSRGHMHSAHSSVRSGMWSPLRASLSLSATTVSPGGRRIQAREHFLMGGNEKNCHIPPTHFFCVGGFSHLSDFCPRTPAFFIGVFHEFNCFPPNLAFSIGKKQDNCLFPPTEISAIVGGKAGNEKTCLHFFEAWA